MRKATRRRSFSILAMLLGLLIVLSPMYASTAFYASAQEERAGKAQDREFISLPSETIPANQSPSGFRQPWITRFMETDWEKIGEDGIAEPKENTTGTVEKPEWANLTSQNNLNPKKDYNKTMKDGNPIILQQVEPDEVSILSDPVNSDDPATPLTPAKRGHWFPRHGYARMYFDFEADSWYGTQYSIHLEIERDQDTYARTLTVSCDGSDFFTAVIGSNGFHADILTPTIWFGGVHTIRIQINWGAYVDKQWKLEHFWVYNPAKEPLDVNGEYTHQDYHCNLRYLVEMGPDTIVNLKIENDWDPTQRSLRVYVDDVMRFGGTCPGEYEISLGDYDDSSVHELRIDIYDCSSTEYAKKITILQVHHMGAYLELDYRYDHQPDSAAIEYFETFYKLYSYHRVEIQLDESLSSQEIPDLITDSFNWENLKSNHFSHRYQWTQQAGDVDWLWCVFVHYIEGNAGFYGEDMIAVADQSWIDWCSYLGRQTSWARRSVLMHEFGHYLGMPHYSGENPCPCPECCYSEPENCIWEMPTYCVWHWQRGAYFESIWHDPCISTSGWTRQSVTSGFEAYRTLQQSGTLYVGGGHYLYCSGIASSNDWKHGPLYIKELPYEIPLKDIRALEADLELVHEYGRMGDLIITLFDANKERSMVFCLYDSWYSSTSRAYLDYCRAGTQHDLWYEGSHSGSWKATWRFWFDPHTHTSWSLKSELDDGTPQTHTHYTTPYGEKTRLIKYIGIQFARASAYTYHGSGLRVLDLRLRYHYDKIQGQPFGPLSENGLSQGDTRLEDTSLMGNPLVNDVKRLTPLESQLKTRWQFP